MPNRRGSVHQRFLSPGARGSGSGVPAGRKGKASDPGRSTYGACLVREVSRPGQSFDGVIGWLNLGRTGAGRAGFAASARGWGGSRGILPRGASVPGRHPCDLEPRRSRERRSVGVRLFWSYRLCRWSSAGRAEESCRPCKSVSLLEHSPACGRRKDYTGPKARNSKKLRISSRVPVVRALRMTWVLSLKDLVNGTVIELWQRSAVLHYPRIGGLASRAQAALNLPQQLQSAHHRS